MKQKRRNEVLLGFVNFQETCEAQLYSLSRILSEAWSVQPYTARDASSPSNSSQGRAAAL